MPEHIYDADGTPCHGYLALPEGDAPTAGVLVAPAFAGLSDTERATCDRLAGLGYVALGVDYYGHGTLAGTRDEAAALMGALQEDRSTLALRMQAALATLAAQPRVAKGRLGAMGFCFGGKAVLDLARSGADFRAGVSMHGVYDAPPAGSNKIAPALLICHGWEDPLCPPDATVALAQELTAHCDDWQILAHGHTGHAFTNRKASAPGMAYAETADRRSWDAMLRLFDETLG